MDSPLLNATEAAAYLRVSIHTVRGWTSMKRLPVCKVGRRALYRLGDLQRILDHGFTWHPVPAGGPVRFLSFHPQHSADLEQSGLTLETIRAAKVYTVPPDEIDKKLDGLAKGVVSALAFPYHGCDGFERFKVWREEGKTGPKYIQKIGTANHLYFPPGVDLAGDSHLLLVEGEKKALALLQAGFQVVGIGGVQLAN